MPLGRVGGGTEEADERRRSAHDFLGPLLVVGVAAMGDLGVKGRAREEPDSESVVVVVVGERGARTGEEWEEEAAVAVVETAESSRVGVGRRTVVGAGAEAGAGVAGGSTLVGMGRGKAGGGGDAAFGG